MKQSEDDLTYAVADFLSAACPDLLWWHTPNGGKRAIAVARKMKRMGTLRGVPDLQFLLPGKPAHFIELKAEGGYQSPEQKGFQILAEERGCKYAVCRSVEDVQQTLQEWGVQMRIAV